MAVHTESTYRVFCTSAEVSTLPTGVTIVKQYPAFTVVSTTSEIANELRKRYPIEEVTTPKPLPLVAKSASIDQAFAHKQERAPYIRVIRFELPPNSTWQDEIVATGCQLLDPLGRLTVVVSCPNKSSLAKLEQLPNVARISEYVPDIVLSPESVGVQESNERRSSDEVIRHIMTDRNDELISRNEPVPGSFVATFFTSQDAQRAKRRLRRSGITAITEAGETRLIINLLTNDNPQQNLQTITVQSGLRSLRNQYVKRLHNDLARRIIAEGVIDSTPGSLGLTGQGEIVAVADSGLDNGQLMTNHPDFHGRVRHIQSFPIKNSFNQFVTNHNGNDGAADEASGHGTHVAGSIIGNGAFAQSIGAPPIMGTAPQAELVFQAIEQYATFTREVAVELARADRCFPAIGLYGIPDDLSDLFRAAYVQGARIHSNSWGGGDPGDYDQQCEQLDRYVWEQKDVLVVFSAGNEGVDLNPSGDGIDTGSMRSPGTAKNCLTVGASENLRPSITVTLPDGTVEILTYGLAWPNDFPSSPLNSDPIADSMDDIAAFSSRGPCSTGRRKPDVVAPGTLIRSTRSTMLPLSHPSHAGTLYEYYTYMNGTSMATPLVAGCAALVRQYLREQLGIANPTAALVKAALVHSAQYMRYRYARADSNPWADNEQGWGRVSLQHLLNPNPPTKVLFIDYTDKISVNDMREFTFQVMDASIPLRITLVYTDYPSKELINNLNLVVYAPDQSYHNGNDFQSMGVLDSLNNVEGVIVINPQVGDWRVRIIFSNVLISSSGEPQDFALVLSGGGLQQI